MKMHVKDGLMGGGPVVLQQVVCLAPRGRHHRPAQPGEHAAESSRSLVAQLVQVGLPLLGNHQHMPFAQGIDIEKGEHVLILIHTMAGDRSLNHLAEDRVTHGPQDTMKIVLDRNALTLPELFDDLVQRASLEQLIRCAHDEDLGRAGDITSASVIDAGQRGRAVLVARQNGVFCGQYLFGPLLSAFESDVLIQTRRFDGDGCQTGDVIATLDGRLRDLLAIERTLLNFVSHLSGIATLTRRYVEAVKGNRAVICDTRKTTPGWRGLEKYAVRCGGGTLHRAGLFDAALYKDNHLAAIAPTDLKGALSQAITKVRSEHAVQFVEVEVDSLELLEQVLSIERGLIDIVLLDNMDPSTIVKAIALRERARNTIAFEASGGITLANVRSFAETGVERISIGAITHSAPALDLALDLDSERTE